MVVPFPPGGATDAAARIYAQHLGDYLGRAWWSRTRPAPAARSARSTWPSAPDGYTLLMGAVGSHAIHAAMPDKPGYDFGTAFVGVSMATSMPMALAVNNKVPARNVQELIALAKAKPGSITYGSAGPGTSQHMAGELFQVVTGTRLMHVPYRGSGPAITDLLGGQIDMVIETLPALLPQAASGKIRLLAVTTPTRAAALPELPTLIEQGVKDYSVATTYALLAPAGTPAAIVDKLSAGMQKAAAMESVKQAAQKLGADAVATSPADTRRMLQQETARWAEVVRLSAANDGRPDTHDAQAVDLAIIGGGSVGVSLLLQFLLSLPAGGGRPLSLRLYEPQERPGRAAPTRTTCAATCSISRPAICRRWPTSAWTSWAGCGARIPPGWPATGWKARSIRAISCPDRCSAPTWPTPTSGRARWRQAGA